MKKYCAIFLSLLIKATCFAQVLVPPKVIPLNTGLILDFKSDSIKLTLGKYIINDQIAVAYDKFGEPVMYFDHFRIYDKNLNPISDTILNSFFGNYSVTKRMFVKAPTDETTYFLFYYLARRAPNLRRVLLSDLWYCKIEYTAGKANLSQPVKIATDATQFSLSCALHKNGRDMWIVTHKRNEDRYISLLLTKNGVQDSVFSKGIAIPKNWEADGRNYINISPDGKNIAMTGIETDIPPFEGKYFVEASSFDPATGMVSNSKFRVMNYTYLDDPTSIQFAPDSKSFYVLYESYNSLADVYLVHFLSSDLDTWDMIDFPEASPGSDIAEGGMILAPDGKIYGLYENGRNDPNSSQYLFAIHTPNIFGAARNFDPNFRPLRGTFFSYDHILPLLPPYYFRPCSIDLPDTLHCTEFGALRLDAVHPLARSYRWSSGDTTASIEITAPGVYWVHLSGPNCDHTDTVRVGLRACTPTIPNVITPNGDGQNDRWVLDGLEVMGDWQVEIVDRWGQIAFRRSPYDNSWDGSGLAEGVYYYRLHSHKLGHSIRGWVMVVR